MLANLFQLFSLKFRLQKTANNLNNSHSKNVRLHVITYLTWIATFSSCFHNNFNSVLINAVKKRRKQLISAKKNISMQLLSSLLEFINVLFNVDFLNQVMRISSAVETWHTTENIEWSWGEVYTIVKEMKEIKCSQKLFRFIVAAFLENFTKNKLKFSSVLHPQKQLWNLSPTKLKFEFPRN